MLIQKTLSLRVSVFKNNNKELRRILTIIFWVLAVFALLTAPMIPHHHHGEEICFEVNHHADADSHSHDGHEKTACSSYQHFIKGGQSQQRTVGSYTITSIAHLFVSSIVPLFTPMTVKGNGYFYLSHYQSIKLFGCRGLRSPPVSMSWFWETD